MTCPHCGHSWTPASADHDPVACPACGSYLPGHRAANASKTAVLRAAIRRERGKVGCLPSAAAPESKPSPLSCAHHFIVPTPVPGQRLLTADCTICGETKSWRRWL